MHVALLPSVPRLTILSSFISPSPFHSRVKLKPSFSANPSHRSLPFLLPDWLYGFPGLFTATSEHVRFYFFSFPFLCLVPSGRLNVSFWAHVKIAQRIVSYRIWDRRAPLYETVEFVTIHRGTYTNTRQATVDVVRRAACSFSILIIDDVTARRAVIGWRAAAGRCDWSASGVHWEAWTVNQACRHTQASRQSCACSVDDSIIDNFTVQRLLGLTNYCSPPNNYHPATRQLATSP